MSETRWEESGQSAGEHTGAFFDRTRKRLSLLAALSGVHITQRVLSRCEEIIREQLDQLNEPKTASPRQLRQPASAKQLGHYTPQSIETSLEVAEQSFTTLMSLPVLRTGARVREEASSIWTEAQAIRQQHLRR